MTTRSRQPAHGRSPAAAWRCVNKYRTALEQATEKLNELHRAGSVPARATIVARYDYDTALANYTYCAAYTATEKTSAQSTLEVAKAALQEAEDTYDTLKASLGDRPGHAFDGGNEGGNRPDPGGPRRKKRWTGLR